MKKSNFVSPVYNVKAVPIEDLVSQKVNPNSHSAKTFRSLQQSIFNQMYVVGVLAGENHDYDPSTAGMPRPNLIEVSDGDETNTGEVTVGTQVSDDDVAKYFPIRLIDGSHRSQVLRFGKYYFDTKYYTKAEDWFNGENIPSKPGPEMMAYIAWREDFKIPVTMLQLSEVEQMSAEILANSARGSSGLDSMKELVDELIKDGKSPEWISDNLGVDVESIARMQTKSGLKGEFSDCTQLAKAWDKTELKSYERKMQAFLTREATKFINTYDGEDEIPSAGTAEERAQAIGWDREAAVKAFEERND